MNRRRPVALLLLLLLLAVSLVQAQPARGGRGGRGPGPGVGMGPGMPPETAAFIREHFPERAARLEILREQAAPADRR